MPSRQIQILGTPHSQLAKTALALSREGFFVECDSGSITSNHDASQLNKHHHHPCSKLQQKRHHRHPLRQQRHGHTEVVVSWARALDINLISDPKSESAEFASILPTLPSPPPLVSSHKSIVFFQLRHPLRTIASLAAAFRPKPRVFAQILHTFPRLWAHQNRTGNKSNNVDLGSMTWPEQLVFAMRLWVEWVLHTARLADWTYHVEDVSIDLLCSQILRHQHSNDTWPSAAHMQANEKEERSNSGGQFNNKHYPHHSRHLRQHSHSSNSNRSRSGGGDSDGNDALPLASLVATNDAAQHLPLTWQVLYGADSQVAQVVKRTACRFKYDCDVEIEVKQHQSMVASDRNAFAAFRAFPVGICTRVKNEADGKTEHYFFTPHIA